MEDVVDHTDWNMEDVVDHREGEAVYNRESFCLWEVIDVEKGVLNNNVIAFPAAGVFFVQSSIELVPPQRVNLSICHVQVVGRPFSPVFEVDIDETSGSSILKYFPEKRTISASESSSCWQTSASGSPPYWRTCTCGSSSWQTCACGFSSGWFASESSSDGRSFGFRKIGDERGPKYDDPAFSDAFIWFTTRHFEDDEPEGVFPRSFV
ncbi:uncharacterized protein A4U43_C09F11540 [Asparagus officinalis]|uniref:Uncharacterized protein n=1 Tax=Asparagus officinalis TaxID=4686 RepID=A0A5P1E7D3_ASPOF|nr:uncharacterized protein A4U43_C09F11540 [Asparagus officinalis]